jgi:hypothetical protein
MTLNLRKLYKLTFSEIMLYNNDMQHNDAKLNDTKLNDSQQSNTQRTDTGDHNFQHTDTGHNNTEYKSTQHNGLNCTTAYTFTARLSVGMLCVVTLNVVAPTFSFSSFLFIFFLF